MTVVMIDFVTQNEKGGHWTQGEWPMLVPHTRRFANRVAALLDSKGRRGAPEYEPAGRVPDSADASGMIGWSAGLPVYVLVPFESASCST